MMGVLAAFLQGVEGEAEGSRGRRRFRRADFGAVFADAASEDEGVEAGQCRGEGAEVFLGLIAE